MFPLFDTNGDGHLDVEGVERAVDAVVLPVAVAAERCYLAAAKPALDKKAATVMPATMKYALWDVLEIPIKRRCCFAWAEDRKQVRSCISLSDACCWLPRVLLFTLCFFPSSVLSAP